MAAPEVPKGVPFTRALGALAATPLVGSVILSLTFLPRVGSAFSILVLYIAPFAYATAAAFVLPILVLWPPSRRPSYVLAAVWGALAACGAWFVLASQQAGGMSMPRPAAIGRSLWRFVSLQVVAPSQFSELPTHVDNDN